MPILDLRLRKAVRHSEPAAGDRLRAPDGARRRRRGDGPLPARRRRPTSWPTLAAELGDGPASRGRASVADAERIAGELRPGKTLVIWGEGLGRGPDGEAALASLLEICEALDCSRRRRRRVLGPRRRQRPRRARGRLPARRRPGLRRRPTPAATSSEIKRRPARRRARRGHPRPRRPGPRAARRPRLGRGAAPRPHRGRDLELRRRVDQGRRRRPPRRGLRREGGHGHPPRRPPAAPAPRRPPPRARCARSGRCSRSSPRASATRPAIDSAPDALAAIADEVPFYAGLTPEEIGGTGVRWQDARGGRAASRRPARRLTSPARRSPTRGDERGAAARDLPRPLGRRDHRAQRGAALPRARAAGRARARPTPSGSGSADGDEVEVRSNGSQRRRAGGAARADAPGRRVPDRGHRPSNNANGSTAPRSWRSTKRVILPRRRQLRRGDLDHDREVDPDLPGRLHDRPGADGGRAQADRPLPAPLRPEPGRPGRADAAGRRHPQAGRQAGLPPRRRGSVPVRDRPGAGDLLRDHDDRDPARSATSRTASASTGSTSRSASSTSSPSARSRSTACCSRAGRRARSTASSARCAPPRS